MTIKKLEEVDGIDQRRRNKGLGKNRNQSGVMVFLHQHGISTARAVRIYKTYGDDSIKRLRENPYRLSHDLHGEGFKTAENIASKLGIKFDDRSSIEAGFQFAIQTATGNGHCSLPENELIESSDHLE